MKVLFLVENKGRKGGVTKTTRELFERLTDTDNISGYFLGVFPVFFLSGFLRIISIIFFPFFLLKLYLTIINNRIERVVCSHFFPIIALFLLQPMLPKSIKVINWLHIDLESYFSTSSIQSRFYSKLIPFVLKHSRNKLIFVSKESEKNTRKNYDLRNTETIYNLTKIIKTNNSPDFYCRKLIYIGSFEHRKRVNLIIKSLELVDENITLDIVGGDKVFYKDLVNECGLSKRVTFYGHTNPSSILARASALILCSTSEGFPLVLLEANAYNLPVISTDFPTGIKEYFFGTNYEGLEETFSRNDLGVFVQNSISDEIVIKSLAGAISELFSSIESYEKCVNRVAISGKEYRREEILNSWINNLK